MTLDTNQQQVSYIIGRDLARNFAQQGLELDVDILAAALKEGMQGLPSRLTPEQMQAAMQQLQEQLGGAPGEDDDDNDLDPNTMANNKAEGEAFLAENAQQSRRHHAAQRLAVRNHHRRQRPQADPEARR